jgi:hypothetical protein
MVVNPFNATALTLPITVTSTASTSAALPAKGNSLRIVNEGPNVAFISVGSGAQVATLPNATVTATSTPVMPGDTTLSIANDQVYNISAICRATQTATLSVQVGEGL